MDDAEKFHERLRRNILFETIGDEHFEELKTRFTESHYHKDDIIVEDGANGEELHLLVEGRVRITKRTKYGEEMVLALLHPGDFFGELELVDGRPRSARVSAVDDCMTYRLRKNDFERLLELSHPFALRLMQVLSIRLRALNAHFIRGIEVHTERTLNEIRKFEQLIEATKNVNSTLELDTLLNVILETALRIVDGDRGTVYLVDESKGELWSKVLKGEQQMEIRLPFGRGVAGYVAATGDILNIPDAYLDPRFNPEYDRKTGYTTRTILCMPMCNRDGKIIGVFQLLNKRNGRFTADDEGFIDALSVHAAIAVENARLYEQERRKIALDKELIAAREVQTSMIPRSLPVVSNFDFAGYTLPAHEVGGDLYDFIRLDEHRCEIVLADVTGKGLPAALLVPLIKGVLLAQTAQYQIPQMQLKGCNHIVRGNFPRKSFITMVLALVDARTRSVTLANAGHCHPILYRGDTASTKVLNIRGMALNFTDEILCEERTVHLGPGDAIVLYSDGVSEAHDSSGEFYGVERIEAVIAREGKAPAEKILRAIVTDVETFARGTPQHDDITLCVIRATP